ncbi:uncharacterized protein [Mytilus edulis]|uniref:uncharacterized protein isoform X3 n=1 Tax=Mytilus edulis TaxID=6550 RepID=UPI0039EE15BB
MEVIYLTQACMLLLAIAGAVTTGHSEEINAKSGSNATLSCPWTEDSVKWYGIYGHQYSSGKSILSSLPPSLQYRLDIWEKDGYNLMIRNVSEYDEGQYKCSSSNGTKYITMFLIAPPTSVLFDNVVQLYIKGNEDQLMNITCKSVGGHPLPSLQLSKNDQLLATTDNRTLVYTMQPSRIDDRSNLSCTANHSELTIPLSIESVLYLNLQTETVAMETIPTLYEFDVLNASCLATGGRPPTSFEWNLLGDYYNSSNEDVENISPTDTYNVKSVLSLEVNRSFDKRKLTCRAFDSIDNDGVTRSQMLEVYYAPSINIKYQNLTTEDNIRQLICQPQGNPIIYKFYQWEHHSARGEKIRSLGSGSNGILNLPELDRTKRYQDTGIYKCFAENGIVGKDGNKTQSGSVFFVNEGRPQLSIYNPSEQFCKLGSVGSLVVKFTSWPPPLNLTWLKYEDNRNFNLQASERYTMTETAAVIIDSFHDKKIHVDGYIGILHINEVTLKDLTNYTVQIQNDFGIELFTFFLNDIPKYQDYRTNNVEDKGLFYGGPAVILSVLFIAAIVIALFIVWRKRSHCNYCRPKQETHCLNDNDMNFNRQGSIREDSAKYASSSKKRAQLCDGNQKQKASVDEDLNSIKEVELYDENNVEQNTEEYTYAEEETQPTDQTFLQSLIPPPDKPKINVRQNIDDIGVKRLRHPSPVHESEKDDSDAEEVYDETPPIPPRSTGNNAVGRNTKDISYDNTDLAVHVHEVKVEIRETCSFAAENEGYIPEEEMYLVPAKRSPAIHTEHVDCNNTVNNRRSPSPVPEEQNDGIEHGSLCSSDGHGPMSSAPYACYSGNPNQANVSQTSGIRQEKQYSDQYNSMPNALDSWKEPSTAVKTLVADNDETGTKEDEN